MLGDHAPLTRRDRERLQTRQAILEAARAIAAAEGWEAVTMRRLAERVEYSLPVLYTHFENKAALVAELARVGYQGLAARLRAARVRAGDPEAAAVELARAYCSFAWAERDLYEAMHGLTGVVVDAAAYREAGELALAEARESLATWADARRVIAVDLDDAVTILWSALHGIAALALARQLPGGKKRAIALAARAVTDLLAAWQAVGRV